MEIAKATQSLTTAADVQETTKMLMQPNANWEEYLTPAPLSIAFMGELVFISSCGDFSINKNPPKNGYKYIQYPDSFRACLMQVCNSGWHAFNEAHKNMDKIRIQTARVPDYMKAVVKVLFNSPDEVIDQVLPYQLENIRTIADECVILADSVEKKYTNVINLIQELLEACVNGEHFYGEELERFFQMISNIVKYSLSKTLNSFVSTADDTKKLSCDNKLFIKDMLYNQAFQASNVASLVHMISGTYTEVSSKYLMGRESSLGKLMAMDKETPEFLNERLNLQQSCATAQEGILQLVLKNKREFERKTDDRMAKIENGLKAILPAASPQETERIKQIVQARFGEEGEDYY